LEYLHTPHDVELPKSRELLLAAQHVNKQDLEEGSPDHLGSTFDVANAGDNQAASPGPIAAAGNVVPAGLRTRLPNPDSSVAASKAAEPPPASLEKPASGTVVLDIEQGGIIVPSFVGKTVRGAIEQAEGEGLEVDAVGSGIAQDQTPVPGTRVAAGATIVVRFGR
jgi:hypothetical protein